MPKSYFSCFIGKLTGSEDLPVVVLVGHSPVWLPGEKLPPCHNLGTTSTSKNFLKSFWVGTSKVVEKDTSMDTSTRKEVQAICFLQN